MASSLAEKLQLKAGRLLVLNAPDGYAGVLTAGLPGIAVLTGPAQGVEAVLLFVTDLAEADRLAPGAVQAIRPGGLVWIAYPKGTSKVKTDVNRDRLWPVLEPLGWRPVRQVALDDLWSAMRFRPAGTVGK